MKTSQNADVGDSRSVAVIEVQALPREEITTAFQTVRGNSEEICRPLQVEDYVVQTMDDVSPPKWHLAHTSWFFETFLLKPFLAGYREFHPQYAFLFNSYYEAVGERHPRPQRGLLSRPTVRQVYEYRSYIDHCMVNLLETAPEKNWPQIESLIILGLNHEQQHQELLLTDLKHILAENPLHPVYQSRDPLPDRNVTEMDWVDYSGGLLEIGFDGSGFAYDNECPRHRTFLQPYRLGSRLITNGEFLEFMEAGGYRTPQYWLSDGWATVQQHGWESPLYWERVDGDWWMMTLSGFRQLEESEPVCHVSYFEADAFARWRDKRLPTEAEWEVAAPKQNLEGNFFDQGVYHPLPDRDDNEAPRQLYGDVWEWTQSPYTAYPGFKPAAGAIGEYNGKFMCNQFVLRGGSCATSAQHVRPTYRNFFQPWARWQFSGFRLADDKL